MYQQCFFNLNLKKTARYLYKFAFLFIDFLIRTVTMYFERERTNYLFAWTKKTNLISYVLQLVPAQVSVTKNCLPQDN